MQAKKLMMAMAIIVFSCFLAAANKCYARQPNVPGTAKWVLDVAASLPDSYSELAIHGDTMYFAVGNKLMVVDLGRKKWSISDSEIRITKAGVDLVGKLSSRISNKIKRKLRPVREVINPEALVLYECKKNGGQIRDLAIDKNGIIYFLEFYKYNRCPPDYHYRHLGVVALLPTGEKKWRRVFQDVHNIETYMGDSEAGMAIDNQLYLVLPYRDRNILYYIQKESGNISKEIRVGGMIGSEVGPGGNIILSGPIVGPGNKVYLVHRDIPSGNVAKYSSEYQHLTCFDRYGNVSWTRTDDILAFPGHMLADTRGNIYIEFSYFGDMGWITSLDPRGNLRFSHRIFFTNDRPIIGSQQTIYATGFRLLNTVRLWGRTDYTVDQWRERDYAYDFPEGVSANKGLLQGNNQTIYGTGADASDSCPVFAFRKNANIRWGYGSVNQEALGSPVMDERGVLYVMIYDSSKNRTAIHAIHTSATGMVFSDWPMFRADPGRTNCQPGYIRLP